MKIKKITAYKVGSGQIFETKKEAREFMFRHGKIRINDKVLDSYPIQRGEHGDIFFVGTVTKIWKHHDIDNPAPLLGTLIEVKPLETGKTRNISSYQLRRLH